jgi:Mrp family chromosome partitioning ATPase
MLETLNQPPGPRSQLAEEPTARPDASVPAPEEPAADEEMPFIEVGGPRGAVSGSPDVLAHPAKASTPSVPPAVPVEKEKPLPPVEAAASDLPADLGPWSVQFRPWGSSHPTVAPTPRMAPELIAYHQPDHPVSTQYRMLLQGLLGHLPTGRGQVLLFTSPAPWTGTTTVLLNLAITAARNDGRRVAAVDANLRRPALAERLGVVAGTGLRDVLAGLTPLVRAVQKTAQPQLWALPAGQAGTGEVRLPLDWLMPTLSQLRDQFDLVFVDAPSWNEGSEVSALAATCDAVFMVLHQKDTERERCGPLAGLRQPPTNLQGCILTIR